MKYKLFQLKNKTDYMFMELDFALEHGFSLDDYEVVYEGEVEPGAYIEDTLEQLFIIFNIHHPQDFKGHSMSVGDVVQVCGEFYYTNCSGFEVIKNRDLLQ